MRELKFRAWDKRESEMITSGIEFEIRLLERSPKYKDGFGSDTIGFININDEEFKVMQYTGLKDRNGVEIFEGDILKWRCSKSGSNKVKEYTVSIEWLGKNAHGYSLTIHHKGENWATQKSYWNPLDREVIGNIHQHPHLLNPSQP